MFTTGSRPGVSRIGGRRSLRVRLPLMISALLTTAVATYLWASYRQVENALLEAGAARARGAAQQVASLIGQSTRAGVESLHSAASDAAIRQCLQDESDDACRAARRRLASLSIVGVRDVALWNANDVRVLDISSPATTAAGDAAVELPAVTRPPAVGFNPLQVTGNIVFTDSAAEVLADPPSANQAASSARLGYIVVRSTLSVNPPGALNRLVGTDATILVGNAAGGMWSDLSRPAPAPPLGALTNDIAEYRASGGERRLGALSVIRGTPWGVWVEFSRSAILAPARAFLGRMIGIGLVIVAVGVLLARRVSVGITRPLHELTEAADQIAGKNYSTRITTSRPDEIGRLGRAFDAMAQDVASTRQQLDGRLVELTSAIEALRTSEAHFRTIVEVALDCIITVDAQGRVVEFNPAAEKTFGYRKEEAVGRELADLIVPPADRDAHREGLARYIATGASTLVGRLIEMTGMRRDGTLIPVELAISAVPSDGPPIITGVIRDLTSRQQALQALRESEDLFSKSFQLSPDPVAIVRVSDRTLLQANDAYCRFVGRAQAELIGKPTLDSMTWLREAERIAFMRALEDGGACLNVESAFRVSDGRVVELAVSSRQITLKGESCVLSVLRDVTERKRTEAAAAHLAAIVGSSGDAIIGKDLAGIVTSWNAGAKHLFGYTTEEMVGQSITRLIPADYRHEETEILGRIHRDEVVRSFDTVRLRKDGSPIEVSVTVSPIKDAAGHIVGASKVARDITERRRAAKEIQELNASLERRVHGRTAALEAANRELEAFSYSVSHDLRAPLRGIDSFSRMVIEDHGQKLDAEGQRQLNVIRAEAQRMGQLIDELLNFSRLGRQEVRSASIDMNALVQSVLDEWPGTVAHVHVERLPAALGDRAMIRQVLVNLINNAVKFYARAERPAIEISGDAADGISTYRVKDNGVGFDARYAGKLFGVFQRLHSEDEFEGTGVGLAIVQRIVHRHGGTVAAEGTLNEGATFSFTLPGKPSS